MLYQVTIILHRQNNCLHLCNDTTLNSCTHSNYFVRGFTVCLALYPFPFTASTTAGIPLFEPWQGIASSISPQQTKTGSVRRCDRQVLLCAIHKVTGQSHPSLRVKVVSVDGPLLPAVNEWQTDLVSCKAIYLQHTVHPSNVENHLVS